MSLLGDIFSGNATFSGSLDRLANTFDPSTTQGSALAALGQQLNSARDNTHMEKVFAANPNYALKLYGAKNQQDDNEINRQSAQAKLQSLAAGEDRQKMLADTFADPQNFNSGDQTESQLIKLATIDPQTYGGELIKYRSQKIKATQPDWKVQEVNNQLVRYDANNPSSGVQTMMGGGSATPDVKGESELRKEFDNLNKDYRVVNDAYNKIKTVEKDPSAAGDLSLIFAYMKLLDPASTVREGEFATAQNAAGVPTQVQNLWNRAKTGERLSPEQRADFLNQGKNLYESQAQSYSAGVEKYRGLAADYGFNPDRIVKPLDNKPAANNNIEKQKAELRAKIAKLKAGK